MINKVIKANNIKIISIIKKDKKSLCSSNQIKIIDRVRSNRLTASH